jgi:hypothetical protein
MSARNRPVASGSPTMRSHDELAGGVVGEHQQRRIGFEDAGDRFHDVVEQGIEVGGGEGRLRDASHRLDLARPALEQTRRHERAGPSHQLLGQERLHHVVVGALAQSADARRRARQRAQHQDRDAAEVGLGPQLLDDLVAADPGQHQVEDEEVDVGRELERPERRLAGADRFDLIALGLEQLAQQRRRVAVVFDDEDAGDPFAHRTLMLSPRSVVATTRLSSSGVNGFDR